MKRPGLILPFFVATLFLAAASRAEEPKPANPPAPARMQVNGNRAAELLKRFDKNGDGKLDDDERADAHEEMFKEQMNRQASLGNGAAAEQFRVRLLEMFDKNKDGRLDDDERAEARKYSDERGLGPGGDVREELVKRFDKNTDGKLDEGERAALQAFLQSRNAAGAGAPGPLAMRDDLMMRFDRNTDGKIDDREMADLEKVVRVRIDGNPAQLNRYDLNKDGKIDDAEWASATGLIKAWLNESKTAPRSIEPQGNRRSTDTPPVK